MITWDDALMCHNFRPSSQASQIPWQVDDWETGERVTIALDRAVPPAETAAALYRVARKQGRTGQAIAPILEVGHPFL